MQGPLMQGDIMPGDLIVTLHDGTVDHMGDGLGCVPLHPFTSCKPFAIVKPHDNVTCKYTEGRLVFKTGSQLLTKSHNTDKETNLLDVDAHYSVLPVKKRPTCARWCPWYGMAQQSNKCLLLFVSKGRRGAIDVLCSNIYLCTVKYYWSTRWAQGAFQSGHASTHTSVLTPLPAIPPHTGRPSTTPTPLAILPHIAMQLVLIDILSFPPCPVLLIYMI